MTTITEQLAITSDTKYSNTIYGVDLSNSYAVASFLLTQMHIKSGVNCLMGYAHIPTSNANNVNHAIINWDRTIDILNAALRASSLQTANQVTATTLPQSYDYHLQIVENELHSSCFFLNEHKVCTFKAPGHNIDISLPRQPMLKWIEEQRSISPDIHHDSMKAIMSNIKKHAEEAKGHSSNDNHSRSI